MNNPKLKEHIMNEARRKDICAPGLENMRINDIPGLVDYYVANPDWCLERDFPDLQTLSESFAEYEDKGVYINKVFHGETFSHLQTYIFHNCRGNIKVAMDYEAAIIPMLYFTNGCNVTVSCEQNNVPGIKVPLYVTDESNNVVGYEDNEYCEFKVHKIKPIEP